MTDNDDRIIPEVVEYVRAAKVAFWRGLARENLGLGFTDLARRCETIASNWEFLSEEPVPCAD